MRKHILVVAVLVALLFATTPISAAVPTGEVNLSLGYEWDSDDQSVVHNFTQTGFRLALDDSLDFGGRFHFSTQGWWDWKQKEGNIALDQLWLSGYYNDLDYQLGRQVISWGTADGFNPTNYFTRMNTNSLLSGDLGGEPLWAGEAIYYGSGWSLTGIVVPFFTPQEVDSQMAKMIMEQGQEGAALLKAINDTNKPRSLGRNSEVALRAETQLAGFDVQASYFSGFEPLPGLETVIALDPVLGPVDVELEGTYRRQHVIGFATTGTMGSVGVWGEVTYGGPAAFGESENPLELRIPMSVNERYLQAVVGGDYTFNLGRGLLAQAQYIYQGQGSLFSPYVQPTPTGEPGEVDPAHYLYGRLGYDFSQDSSLDLVILHGTKEKGGLIRPAYTHRFPNSIQLELSLIHTYGDEEFSAIPTQGRIAVKHQF